MNQLGGDGFAQLRRWTVIVLLGLLIFVTVVEVIDGLFFADKFHTDSAFYVLVGGMVSGLFVAEGVRLFSRNGKKDD